MTWSRMVLILTASRLAFAAAFAVACAARATVLLLPFALLVELSDLGDGLLARRTNTASLVGNVYDSMTDHVARMTEFLSLFALSAFGLLPVLIFLWRDGVVVTTRLVAATSGSSFLTTRASGKAKGIAQGACIVWLSATQSIPEAAVSLHAWESSVVIWIAAVVTVLSALDYLFAYRALLVATVGRHSVSRPS